MLDGVPASSRPEPRARDVRFPVTVHEINTVLGWRAGRSLSEGWRVREDENWKLVSLFRRYKLSHVRWKENALVSHGPLTCTRCWAEPVATLQECGPFRLVRDPGHWGATDPEILVLGISKGNTQSKAFGAESFETIAFKGIRHRILKALQAVGLLVSETAADFERRFSASEPDYAFASVVRCSITAMDRRKRISYSGSNVLPAFRRGSAG